MSDRFRFATSDLVIACPSKDRYFDLDAVRTAGPPDIRTGPPDKRSAAQEAVEGWKNGPAHHGTNPGGAPPLDWWQIDPNTPYDPPKKDGPMASARFVIGDTREVTAGISDGSVDLILTSPPFLALRSYLPADHPDKSKEIGSEANPAAFIDVLLELTAEWRRILAPHGSICIELGDTYSGSGGAGGDYQAEGLREGQPSFDGSGRRVRQTRRESFVLNDVTPNTNIRKGDAWPLAKSLALVPELYRIGLAYGLNPLTGNPSPAGRWRVRNVVRWVRPNPPVGALGDKFRPATSDLVVACVAGDRWFDLDAVRVPLQPGSEKPRTYRVDAKSTGTEATFTNNNGQMSNPAGAPPLDWWQIVPGGYSGAHYAVWPPALCERPIEAMCPRRVCRTCGKPSRRITTVAFTPHGVAERHNAEAKAGGRSRERPITEQREQNAQGMANGRADKNVTTLGWSSCGCPNSDELQLDGYHTGTGWRPGLVFDPFVGSGTTLVVAHGHSRDSIGADLDPRNAELAKERLGMFLDVETTERVA